MRTGLFKVAFLQASGIGSFPFVTEDLLQNSSSLPSVCLGPLGKQRDHMTGVYLAQVGLVWILVMSAFVNLKVRF